MASSRVAPTPIAIFREVFMIHATTVGRLPLPQPFAHPDFPGRAQNDRSARLLYGDGHTYSYDSRGAKVPNSRSRSGRNPVVKETLLNPPEPVIIACQAVQRSYESQATPCF